MRAKFNGASSNGWLGAFQMTLIVLLLGAASMTSFADTPKEVDYNGMAWTTVVTAPDIMAEVEAVGGEWLALQYLPETNRPESDFAGFLLRPANCAFVCDKEVLNKFVKESYTIYDRQTFENISYEEFKAMPLNKILGISIMFKELGKKDGYVEVRVILNKKDYDINPLTAFVVDLSVVEKLRMWNICNEPQLVK